MAGADRAQTRDLIDWTALAQKLRSAGLFSVLRHAEARASAMPRIGRSKLPADNIVDLAQEPSMGFADSTLSSLEFRYNRPQLRGYWLGLTGPMGALPIHLTEFAYYERKYAKSRPFGDWLDVISGRMLQLYYRAWAESQPAASADRPGDDRFAFWLGAVSGALDGASKDSAFFDRARTHYAALFSGSRSAIALQDGLSHLLGQPVRVVEYIPKWRNFEPEDRSSLGQSFASLGNDAVLGRKVYSAADAFRVIIRANDLDAYRSLLPGGDRFAVAAEAIEAFKPTHLEWDITVELDSADAPPAKLDGFSRLGWMAWVKRPGPERGASARKGKRQNNVTGQILADAHLRKNSLRKRKPAA